MYSRRRTLYSSLLIKIQPDATVGRYLFTANPLYMFRVSQHTSSGVLKTVTAASSLTLNYDARNHELKMYSMWIRKTN